MRVFTDRDGGKSVNNLSPVAILTVALWHYHGMRNPAEMGALLKIPKKRLAEYADLVVAMEGSPLPLIRRMLAEGLPDGLSESLPENVTIRCPKCGKMLSCIPCVECNRCATWKLEIRPRVDEYRARPPKFPTNAIPGTPRKIEIMRRRVERGESPGHPDDLFVYHPNEWMYDMMSVDSEV